MYGILGVFLAVPIAAVVQVLLDRFVLESPSVTQDAREPALTGLRERARALRQRMRGRLRERSGRMGIDPDTPEHVVDAVDKELEEAVERVTSMIRVAQRGGRATDTQRSRIVQALQGALQRLEHVVERVDALATEAAPDALPLDELTLATRQAASAVEGAEAVVGDHEAGAPGPSPRLDRP